MSESAPERSSGGNVFTKKLGPLPMWGWMAIVLGLALVYSLYKKNQSSNATNTSAAQAAGNAPGGVDASLVPQFINQEYVNTTPPAAPNVTVNNTVPGPTDVIIPPMSPQPTTTPGNTQTPPARTISGSPGSYTTGLPGGLNEWTSTGKYSLNTIAKSHGMTAQQLVAVSEGAENNPLLKNYVSKGNFNAPLPAGVQIFIPNANWSKSIPANAKLSNKTKVA